MDTPKRAKSEGIKEAAAPHPRPPRPDEPATSKAAATRRPPPKASAGTLSVSKAGDKGEKQPPSTSTAPLTGTSYAEAAKRVRVAVLPEDYPQVYLSNEELAELEEAIMDDVVTSEWDSAVAFRGIHFRVGYLLIDCLDQDSADWLRTVTPQLRTWKGVPLDTRVGEDIPAAYNVTVFCPRSAERSDEELLMMLGRQNRMEVDSWKVISRRNDGGGALLVIGIDQLTRDEIVSKGHQLNFRFGTVSPQEPLGAKEEAIADMDVESEDEHLSHSQEVAQEPLLEDIDEKEADVAVQPVRGLADLSVSPEAPLLFARLLQSDILSAVRFSSTWPFHRSFGRLLRRRP
ncbi:uncharacterized protein LOC122319854 [Drosophila ficusphila]|uniref:uncharacterized protein LOC122319854 n=1 Tax=Drosophila ficusphila TaxID=30025 RepID=UPI001C899592|nr:uncharacterized protein LOC122319854 [Drosophila ficusphila]